MILFLLAALAQQAPVAGPPAPEDQRYHHCLQLATTDPVQAQQDATDWRLAGGGFVARQCLGVAYANQEQWVSAATEFAGAAQDAQATHDARAATYWAEAGNAWLAAKQPGQARGALDAALASGTLTGVQRGEAQLDRARALVAEGRLADARTDIDNALTTIDKDPMAWLLSATLARRMNDLARARVDIARAKRIAPDQAPIELESGNIAAVAGDADAAKVAWQQTIKLAPDSAAAASARTALQQFDTAPARTP